VPELILRLRTDRAGPTDVRVAVEASHTVAELAAALAAHLGHRGDRVLASTRTGEVLDPDALLGGLDLLTGDELVLGPGAGAVVARVRPDLTADTTIDVTAGPETGRSVLVHRPGRYVVGRAPDATVRIDDPSVSRRHLTIELDRDGAVTIDPRPASANGVLVNGAEITSPTAVGPTDHVTLGGTRLAVRPAVGRPDTRSGRLGRIDFHRTPYRPPVVVDRSTEPVGPVPERPEPRRLPAIAVVAPLAAGLLMYLFTRQLQFLALMLLSPVVMIGTAVEDRRSGRRAVRDRVSRFRSELVERRREFEQLRDAERIDRFRASPDLADLIRRAELRTVDLWARGRAAPDFLSLRLGLGAATVGFAVELERGGADDLRDEAAEALRGVDELADVPVTVALDEVLAIHGRPVEVDGVTASLVVQAATLHSPEDLVIVAAISSRRSLDWLRWLPHARSVTSPLSGDHVARTPAQAGPLVERLLDAAEMRAVDGHVGPPATWPRVMVVLDAGLELDPARVARLLDLAPGAGFSVVWLATSPAEVPRQATRTLVLRRTTAGIVRGRLWATDPTVAETELEVEHLRPERADRVARALAPIRDASTMSLATTIPRTAPLLEVLGVGRPSASWVVEQWAHRPVHGLRFPIGLGADGPVELDLVEDGPHALVGGTSGAGKSELLQSMVASLAVHHPPNRLNLLFVDYKGGAASQVFERLPHTVGYVTNLSADLAARALTSLRAELHRRMALLEGRAKDLAELLSVAPDDAPASLVIVVDEFATLAREVPEFVTGIVDIAQRGRSLGIHLVLATQRPTGSVNENILANTNLRISLRMLDRAESTAVVGVPDAADIPVPLRGRGIVRLGPRRLVEFQSAFAGAPLFAEEIRPPVLVRPFESTDGSSSPAVGAVATRATQLDAVLDAIRDADRRLGRPPPRRPWRDVLPESILLDDVLDDPLAERAFAEPGRFVAVGLLDAPERQEQRPAIVDLDDGGVLVFGSGGAGSSTLLRTVAAAVTTTAAASGVDVAIVAFDAAGRGCAALAALPTAEVVAVDDLEAVTRQLVVLERELERRRRLLVADPGPGAGDGAADVEHVVPRIVVLIDGLGALLDALLDATTVGDEWVERIVRLVVDGRQVGIHTVATAGRRSAVPARVHAAVANRIVLRHADDSAYADHGIPSVRARGLVPGRGLWSGPGWVEPVLVQIASVSVDAAARPQGAALAELGARLAASGRRSRPAVPASVPLTERDRSPLLAAGGLGPALGRADITGATVTVDLEWSHLAVYGPPRSGRSTALATIATQLVGGSAVSGCEVVVAGSASSGLRRLAPRPGMRVAFGREVGATFERLAAEGGPRRVLVLDDLDALDDPALVPVLERFARDESIRLVAAMEPRIGFTTNPLVALARRSRRQLVLQPDDPAEFLQLTGTRLVLRPGLRMPPGRGVLLVDRVATVVQVTDALSPRDPESTSERQPPTGARVGARARAGVAA
jgi:DNA segregation ATPase FtsK/SpoIIIE, S-DNA-T family